MLNEIYGANEGDARPCIIFIEDENEGTRSFTHFCIITYFVVIYVLFN